MDWDGLSAFLQDIKVFLQRSRSEKGDAVVESLMEQCEFYLSTLPPTTHHRHHDDEVDTTAQGGGTYLNMDTNKRIIVDNEGPMEEHSEYIDMDDYVMKSSAPSPTNLTPAECPYIGLPYAHLKLNKNVSIIQENMKMPGKKKSAVTCALLKGSWLLLYSSPSDLKPRKYFFVHNLVVPNKPEQFELILHCSSPEGSQSLHFESGTVRDMWIKAIREELPSLEDSVYDDPNNLRMDEHLYKTIKFDYDIPKMPPKPVDGSGGGDGGGGVRTERRPQADGDAAPHSSKVSPNRTEFQLKYQEIKEQLASQLKQQKSTTAGGNVVERPQRSPSASCSPQKKFGRFISIFRSSTAATATAISPTQEEVKKNTPPVKTAKIMKYKRNTTIFSPDYEIVGS